jgi:MoxR-like ATPase
MQRPNQNVAHVDFKRLLNPQIRILLQFMGVNNPPAGKPDRIKLLEQFRVSQLEKLQKGYDVVVLNKLPSFEDKTANDTVEKAEQRFWATMAKLHDDKQYDAMYAIAETLKTELAGAAKAALKAATEDYRPIVIKHNGKTNKVQGVLPAEFERMVQLGSQRVPIMLVGPAGCGKTYLSAKLAEALGFKDRYADQSLSEGVTEADLIGRLLPTGKGGAFEFHAAPLLDIYENGGVFLFDEGDAADSNMMVFLNKLLANDEIYVPQRFNKPLVRKHKDFVAIMAANTFGHGSDTMYVGRNQLDAATLDRFRAGMIMMDYSEKVERNVADAKVYEWGLRIRKAIRKHGLRRIMSTRTLINMTKMAVNCDWTEKQWNEAFFADWSADERRAIEDDLNKFSSADLAIPAADAV